MTDTAGSTPVLRQILASRRRQLAGASALFVSHQAGEALVPVVAGAVIDRAIVPGDGAALARWLVVLAVVFAVLSTSWRWGDRVFTGAFEGAAHDLRLRLAARVTAPEGTASRIGTGEVVSVASSDVDGAVGIQGAVAAMAAATLGIVVAAIALLVISPRLGLLVLVGMPPVLALLQVLVRPIERRVAAQQADVARAAATATDLLRGLRVVKGLHVEANAAERYRRASRTSLGASLRANRLYAGQGALTVAVTAAFVGAIALVGGRLAAEGRITVGALVAAVGVTQFLVSPLGRIGYAVAELGSARASAGRVAGVLDAPGSVAAGVGDGAGAGRAVRGALEVRAVHHGALVGFDLSVDPGRLVGVAAPQAESDVLGELLGRQVDPARGSLSLDGAGYVSWPLAELRRSVLVAEHDAPLFAGTVASNVTGGGPVPPELDGLLASISADEVAAALSHGYETPVAERGLSLSGGQRQRIALARALVAEPAVLVLQDPTTAIDSVTEARLAQGLRRARHGRTTIVLSSSPALLAVADEVVFVEDGAVSDVGTHAELAARNDAYARAVLA
ncbi:ABC transporter ATP-binding protein [soil metagenome]